MQMYTVLSQEKTISPYFQGVYSRDTLPPLQENMCAIVNSDDSSQPETHWRKQFNSPPQLENQSQCRRKTSQLGNMNETTQLNRRKLNSATGTKQLNSAAGTKQLSRRKQLNSSVGTK
ncbi:hypothetical protein TNCV_181371 [Trichonephila clavipes]|nr:hypothetical protein TNCV_181371 [Trichonephila clavipes]